jgi:hypothetical protein
MLFYGPVIAFVACTVSGITNFGDGVVFLVGWSFYHLIFDDPEFTLADAMIYISILPLASLPPLLYASRHEIRKSFAYGCVLSLASSATTPVGVYLIVSRGSAAVIIIGCLCFAFASLKLIPSTYAFGQLRKPLPCNYGNDDHLLSDVQIQSHENDSAIAVDSVELAAQPTQPDDDLSPVQQQQPPLNVPAVQNEVAEPKLDPTETVWLVPAAHAAWADSCFSERPGLKAWIDYLFPPICEYCIETTIGALVICGLASGFLGGMMGTSSPPQLIVFSMLSLTKGAIRSVKVLSTTVSNVLRLVLLSSSSAIPFYDNWAVYVAVAAASLLGAAFGSWLRNDLNQDHLLWCLYWLLWFTGAFVIGIFEKQSSEAVLIAFLVGTGLLALLTLFLYLFPRKSRALIHKSSKCCNLS